MVQRQKNSSLHIKNLVRGATNNTEKRVIRNTINNARKLLTAADIKHFVAASSRGTALDDVYGAAFPPSPRSLFIVWQSIEAIGIEIEAQIQAYRILENKTRIIEALKRLVEINQRLLEQDKDSVVSKISDFISDFGYSACIARKAIYAHALPKSHVSQTIGKFNTQINEIYSKKNTDHFKFYTTWLIDHFDFKTGVFDNINIQIRHFEKSPPASHLKALINKCLFPLTSTAETRDECYLYYGTASLIDATIETIILPTENRRGADKVLAQDGELIELIDHIRAFSLSREHLSKVSNVIPADEIDEHLYRLAAAIPEHPALHFFRRCLDKEMMHRFSLFTEAPYDPSGYFEHIETLNELIKDSKPTGDSVYRYNNHEATNFLRSFAALHCLNTGDSFHKLSSGKIIKLLSSTVGFSKTLSTDEIKSLNSKKPNVVSAFVNILSLIMLYQKNPNEDTDFSLRIEFQIFLKEFFKKDILDFIKWTHKTSPGLTDVLVDLCDTSFLEQLYLIFKDYKSVLAAREQLCRWAASAFDSPYYLEIAERLALDSKIQEIRGTINDTRIYVDDIRFKQWLLENLTPELRRFLRHFDLSKLESPEQGVSAPSASAPEDKLSNFFSLAGTELYHHICVSKAFTEFCHNETFGIDSYLSRRIRHGTIAGHLQPPIRKILDRHITDVYLTAEDIKFLNRLFRDYCKLIKDLKDDYLQFKTPKKTSGLFDSNCLSTQTRARIFRDSHNLVLHYYESGTPPGQILLAFTDICWSLIESDLQKVRNTISATFRNDIKPLFKKLSSELTNINVARALEAELDQQANSLFIDVINWFKRSASSSMSVSIKQLIKVVEKEINSYLEYEEFSCNIQGNGDVEIFGITYHTLYDILYVLVHNAAKYADIARGVDIYLSDEIGPDEIVLYFKVSTHLKSTDNAEEIAENVSRSLDDANVSNAMTRETGSGLGKVKVLITNHPKKGSYSWHLRENLFTFEFSLPLLRMPDLKEL